MNTPEKAKRILCIAAAAAIMLSCTGCGNKNAPGTNAPGSNASDSGNTVNTDKNGQKTIKIEYRTDKVTLPEGISSVENLRCIDDKFYFTDFKYNYDDATGDSSTNCTVYCLDQNGAVVSKKDISPVKNDGDTDVNISQARFLDDGSILYVENHSSMNEETSEYSETNLLKKLDPQGNLVMTVDVSELLSDEDMQNGGYISEVKETSDGNICINFSTFIIVLDSSGKQLFRINDITDPQGNSWAQGMIKASDGNIYVAIYSYSQKDGSFSSTLKLHKINFETKALEESVTLNSSLGQLMDGYGNYFAYAQSSNGSGLVGIKEDGSNEEIINWTNCGADVSYSSTVGFMGDNFVIVSYNYDTIVQGSSMYTDDTGATPSLLIVRKLADSEMVEKKLVQIACDYMDESLRHAVVKFNDESTDTAIQIKDYSIYNDYSTEEGMNAGSTKLNNEITAGNIPDILFISDTENFDSYRKKGLFADLNTYIEKDQSFDRSKYCDNIFRQLEVDGKLYAMPTSFIIYAFAAKKSYIPNDGSVDFATIDSIKASHPDISMFQQTLTRETFMNMAVVLGKKSFVDTATGKCNFNSDEFKRILEISKELPEEFDYETASQDPSYWENFDMQYRKDKTIFADAYLSDYSQIRYTEKGQFGEDVSFVGFPGTGIGPAVLITNSIAISASTPNSDACWSFLKYLISPEAYDTDVYTLSVNKEILGKMAEKAMTPRTYIDENGKEQTSNNTYYMGSDEIDIGYTTQSDVDRLNGFLDNCDNVVMSMEEGIFNIIKEESANYYSGQNDINKTAEMIQSRVEIYISEQN
ncbi:MAG: extracellular solute-binding protein [Oscillospiraceae bacterium]|nr:extracellular solute-binding protein [Oscillospiraceae bacterium]